jgi:hypothetical protein
MDAVLLEVLRVPITQILVRDNDVGGGKTREVEGLAGRGADDRFAGEVIAESPVGDEGFKSQVSARRVSSS